MTERKIPTTEDVTSYKNTPNSNMPSVIYADLPLLTRIIFRRRHIYIIFLIISAILSLIYSAMYPPLFRTEMLFGQPEIPINLQTTTVSVAELKRLPLRLFLDYKNNLSSKAIQRRFFEENREKYFPPDSLLKQIKVTSSDVDSDRIGRFISIKRTWAIDSSGRFDILSKLFRPLLRVGVYAELPERYFFELSIESPNAKLASQIADDYANYVNQMTITRTMKKVHQEIDQRKVAIKNEITKKLEIAKLERESRILYLEEQALIATSLGYEKPVKGNFGGTDAMPTYLLGAEALESHLRILKERSNDRSFIPGLATLETELNELSKYTKNVPIEYAAHISNQATTPHLASNNRILILLISLGVGLIGASMYNIFVYYIEN